MKTLCQVHWAASFERLPSALISDVITSWPSFLRDVAWWVEGRRARARSRAGPAFLAIHSSKAFPGLGVYSLSEVFHRAGKFIIQNMSSFFIVLGTGLRLSLPEQSLFDNASRTARLCIAFRVFAADCEMALWPFAKRYLHGFKFAVEHSDRLFYGRYLRVYGKGQTWVCARHGAMLDNAVRPGIEAATYHLMIVFKSRAIQTTSLSRASCANP